MASLIFFCSGELCRYDDDGEIIEECHIANIDENNVATLYCTKNTVNSDEYYKIQYPAWEKKAYSAVPNVRRKKEKERVTTDENLTRH